MHDRHSELRGVVARLDQLRNDIHSAALFRQGRLTADMFVY